MNLRDKWEFSPEAECRLKKLSSMFLLGNEKSEISINWLALLNYNCEPSDNCQVKENETGINTEEEIVKVIKKCMENETFLPEDIFLGISLSSLDRILLSVLDMSDDIGFYSFCKFIAQWKCDSLVEHSLKSVVLKKLRETSEASSCVIFAVKELAISKPDKFCQNALIPCFTTDTNNCIDVELLSEIYSVLPDAQKDILIRKFTKKADFCENDWKLLLQITKDLSQNSLLSLIECIQKFSHKFTKSVVFGRFLVNFCKNFEFIPYKGILKEVVEKHETLLKAQAMKYLDSV